MSPAAIMSTDVKILALSMQLKKKSEVTKQYKHAVNDYLSLKLDYLHKSNKIRLNQDKVKEELELSKAPTEKQILAYTEEKYSNLKDEVKIAEENVNLIKKDLELIDNEIRLAEYAIRYGG